MSRVSSKKRPRARLRSARPVRDPKWTLTLRESEARRAAILDTALDSVIAMDHQGRIVDFNPAAERTFGYRRDEVIVSARVLPITSSRRYPNVRSAAGLKSTIRPWWSIAMTLSRAVSRMAARRASLSRRVNVHLGSRTGRALRSRARGRFFDDTRDIASNRGAGALPARRPAIAHVPIYRVRENCSLFLLGLGTRGFGEPAAPDEKKERGRRATPVASHPVTSFAPSWPRWPRSPRARGPPR